jgi:hypothetical protein
MRSTFDRAFLVFGGLVALFVALRPDQFIRIASFGRDRITDVAPTLVKALRVIAGFVAVGTLVFLVVQAW